MVIVRVRFTLVQSDVEGIIVRFRVAQKMLNGIAHGQRDTILVAVADQTFFFLRICDVARFHEDRWDVREFQNDERGFLHTDKLDLIELADTIKDNPSQGFGHVNRLGLDHVQGDRIGIVVKRIILGTTDNIGEVFLAGQETCGGIAGALVEST